MSATGADIASKYLTPVLWGVSCSGESSRTCGPGVEWEVDLTVQTLEPLVSGFRIASILYSLAR